MVRTRLISIIIIGILLSAVLGSAEARRRAKRTLERERIYDAPQPPSKSSSRLAGRQERYIAGYSPNNATLELVDLLTGPDSGYDPSTRPGFGRYPTNVSAQFQINNLYELDPVSSTFTVDLRLRLYWTDERLVVQPGEFPPTNGSEYRFFGAISLGNGIGPPNAIWTPDIFFANEVAPEVFDEVIKLQPETGAVFWSRHFLVKLTNQFFLGDFPFDRQNLTLAMTSYSYDELQLSLEWSPDGPLYPDIQGSTFSQVAWDYVGFDVTDKRYFQHNDDFAYDMLVFYMVVARKSTSYYIKTFLPLFLLVALTTVSYWLAVDAVPERLGLTITLVLTIVSFYSSVTQGLPEVNYATNLDWYVFVSFVVAFFSLLEVAAIHHMIKRQSNHILATELDFFCRRFILPFWCLFNIAALVRLPAGSFQWLWLVCGLLMGILLFFNAWLLLYYVWKRYDLRVELEATAYGREHLEDFGEYISGKFEIGLPGSWKRKMHDFVISSTDRAFRLMHMSIPGEKIRKEVLIDLDGDGVLDKVVMEQVTERDKIDQRSLNEDLEKARLQARRASLLEPESAVISATGTSSRPASVYSARSNASLRSIVGSRGKIVSVESARPATPTLTIDPGTLPREAEKSV